MTDWSGGCAVWLVADKVKTYFIYFLLKTVIVITQTQQCQINNRERKQEIWMDDDALFI